MDFKAIALDVWKYLVYNDNKFSYGKLLHDLWTAIATIVTFILAYQRFSNQNKEKKESEREKKRCRLELIPEQSGNLGAIEIRNISHTITAFKPRVVIDEKPSKIHIPDLTPGSNYKSNVMRENYTHKIRVTIFWF